MICSHRYFWLGLALTQPEAATLSRGLPGQLSAQVSATARIHTGRGTTMGDHLFLGSGRPIWNNDGDTATLIDPTTSL